jgi:uncharacterized protein YcfJ
MRKSFLILFVIILSSCAGYSPVVDPQSVENEDRYYRDQAECKNIASQNTSTAKNVAKDTVVGGAVGAGTGALLGVITGSVTTGLAAGAVIGGVAGGAKGAYDSDKNYETIYRNCMRGRGYNVLN